MGGGVDEVPEKGLLVVDKQVQTVKIIYILNIEACDYDSVSMNVI